MANIRKSFNFRTGLQVDNDNFVVNANGLVGIGTSIPQNYLLNVHGDTRVTGLVTTGELYAGTGTVGVLSATSADVSGILTVGQLRVGSSGLVDNVIGYARTTFITDNLGVGIHTTSRVGINTTTSPGVSDSNFIVYGDASIKDNLTVTEGDLILTSGDINASSGIITASSFDGDLNATDLTSGTVNNSRLPATISVTNVNATTFTGSLTGTATTASSLTGSPSITVTDISASDISASNINLTGIVTASDVSVTGIVTASDVSVTGIVTATTELNVGSDGTALTALSTGRLGIGTALPTSEIQVRKASDSLVEIVSDSGEARISIGQSVGVGNSTGVLRFGNSANAFDILNNDTGNINMYLHAGGSGIDTGRFDWIYGQTNAELMSLTYDGKLGIGKINPDTNLHVVGTSTVTGNAWFGGNVTIDGTLNSGTIILPSLISANISTTSGMSTFFSVNVVNDLLVDTDIGIGTDNASPIVNFDARGKSGLIGNLGINTTIQATSSLQVVGQALFDSVGIGTTTSQGEGLYANGVSIVQYDATTTLYDSVLYIRDNGAIGVGTTAVRCQVDFADAGKTAVGILTGESTGARAFMLPPRLTNTQRAGLTTEAGAFIFNLDEAKFQGYTGVAWTDFH